MNCDDVFEVLTRGPFPTGAAGDRAVERHLASCHECRMLAEALRPAVELFHEAVSAEEARDLPGYHGSLANATLVATVATAAPSPSAASNVERPQRAPVWLQSLLASNAWRFAAAVCLGALLATVTWLAGQNGESARRGPAATAGVSLASFQPNRERLRDLAAQELPALCFAWNPRAESANQNLKCCTQCHAASESARVVGTANASAAVTLAAVVRSCQACHP